MGKALANSNAAARAAARVLDYPPREPLVFVRAIGVSGRRKFQDTVRNLFMNLLRKLNSVNRADALIWYHPD